MLHHKWLDIAPNATQQDLIANSFWRLSFVSVNPKLPNYPTPSPLPLGNHKSILQAYDFLFCGKSHLCLMLDSRYKRYHVVFVFLFLTYFT